MSREQRLEISTTAGMYKSVWWTSKSPQVILQDGCALAILLIIYGLHGGCAELKMSFELGHKHLECSGGQVLQNVRIHGPHLQVMLHSSMNTPVMLHLEQLLMIAPAVGRSSFGAESFQ